MSRLRTPKPLYVGAAFTLASSIGRKSTYPARVSANRPDETALLAVHRLGAVSNREAQAQPVSPSILAGAHEPRDLRRGRVSTNRVERHAPERSSGIDPLPLAMMLGPHFVWKPSGALEETVWTGQASFERVYGAPFFDYLAGHPGRCCCLQRRDEFLSRLPSCHRRRVRLLQV